MEQILNKRIKIPRNDENWKFKKKFLEKGEIMKSTAKINLTQLVVDNHTIITKKGDIKNSQEGFLFFSGNKVNMIAEMLFKIMELMEEHDRISVEFGNSVPYLYDLIFFIRGENINDWNRKAEFINSYFVYDIDPQGKIFAANPIAMQTFVGLLSQIEFRKFNVLKQQRNDIMSIQKTSNEYLFNKYDLSLEIKTYNSYEEFHFSTLSLKSVEHFLASREFYKIFDVFKIVSSYYRLLITLQKNKKGIKISVMIITGESTLNQQILRNELIRKNVTINRDISFIALTVYDLLNLIARMPCENNNYTFELPSKEFRRLNTILDAIFTPELEIYLANTQKDFESKKFLNLHDFGTNLSLNPNVVVLKKDSFSPNVAASKNEYWEPNPDVVVSKKESFIPIDGASNNEYWEPEYAKYSIPPVPEVPKKKVNILWNSQSELIGNNENTSKYFPFNEGTSHNESNGTVYNQDQNDDIGFNSFFTAGEYILDEFDEQTIEFPLGNIENKSNQSIDSEISLYLDDGFNSIKDDLMSKYKGQDITISFQSDVCILFPEDRHLFFLVNNESIFLLKKEFLKSLLKYKMSLFIAKNINKFTTSCLDTIISKKIISIQTFGFSKANVISAIDALIKEKRKIESSKEGSKKKILLIFPKKIP